MARHKKLIKLVLQIAVSVGAVVLVVKKIDVEQTLDTLKSSDTVLLLLALLFFNLSKLLSAFRLQHFFRAISLHIATSLNVTLYYIGMFYNLFLPGGIGGDGFKIYWLNKHGPASVSNLFKALLLDRISGLYGLIFLALLMLPWSLFAEHYRLLTPLSIVLLLAMYPAAYVFNRLFFRNFIDVFLPTSAQGVAVQCMQLLCAVSILAAIGVVDHTVEYLVVFLISSLVAVLPISIGGIGARELTFVYLLELVHMDINQGVALSTLFFAITALSSLPGGTQVTRLADYLPGVDNKQAL